MNLKISISGKDNLSLFKEINQLIYFRKYSPQNVYIDNVDYHGDWQTIDELIALSKEEIFIYFGEDTYIQLIKKYIVYFGIRNFNISTQNILPLIQDIPFEIAVIGSLYTEWANPQIMYLSPGFSCSHLFHGWACTFKGDGHDRLVSRQWLEHGPWRTTYFENDITFIEFHQLGLSSDEALNQCRQGHQIMGISDSGGFIQSDYVYEYRDFGIYVPETQVLKVVVFGEEIPDRKLLDSAALLKLQGLGEKYPLVAIHYVFIEEEQAQKYLHKLWLYGLDCRALIDGIEISLAENYHPKIIKPLWVSE